MSRVRARIKDKAKADIVAPLEQHSVESRRRQPPAETFPAISIRQYIAIPYACASGHRQLNQSLHSHPYIPSHSYVGCKRPSLEQGYYEMIHRPNVKLVDLNAAGIKGLPRKGIATTDEEYELDIVILATGYNNLTGSLPSINIRDTDGLTVKQKWEDGVSTYLGLIIPKMPNMFTLYSPHSPSALFNGPPCCEIMADWVLTTIQRMKVQGLRTVEATQEAADEWHWKIQEVNSYTLHAKSEGWYMGSNIPGKKREQLVYTEGLQKYTKEIYEALESWNGFVNGHQGRLCKFRCIRMR